MIVVDTSALVAALTSYDVSDALPRRLNQAASLHSPHLVDSEVVNALRGLVLRSQLSPDRARDALSDFVALPIIRYPAVALIPRIWQLRDSLTAYDATFVALAETLDCPLITCDARLSNGQHAAVTEVFTA